MPRDLEPSLNTKNFTLTALQNNLRLDSRSLTQPRPLKLTFGTTLGCAYVELGKTKSPSPPHPPEQRLTCRVMAQVSASVVKPYEDSPFEGIFTISTEFSPMAAASFEPGRTGPYELVLSRTLDNTLRRARALDLESLCILAKKLVWSVRVDVHFLDHDGGLVDAACVAVIAALSAFRREDVEVRGEEVEIFPVTERPPVKLAILHTPLTMTFSFFLPPAQPVAGRATMTAASTSRGERVTVLDATFAEEQLRSGSFTVAMNKSGEICWLNKSGGLSMEAGEVLECVRIAYERVVEWTKYIEEEVRKDEEKRNKDKQYVESTAENERYEVPVQPI